MLIYSLAIVGLAFLFYLLIPGFGAFLARRRWRQFRNRIFNAAECPAIRYGDLEHDSQEGFIGYYRFIGSLEAIQDSNTVWIRDGSISVSAELSGVTVHVLPTNAEDESDSRYEQNEELLPDEMPQQLPWNQISTLPEGTRLIIFGALYSEKGHTVFRSERGQPLTVVLFDGPERTIFRRSIWTGRQKNEYWNQLTLVSLLTGAIALIVFAYYLSREPVLRNSAILALVAGVLPLLPFFPPGVALVLLYRNLWRMGRIRRAERDLIRILTFRFTERCESLHSCATTLPNGETYAYSSVSGLDRTLTLAPDAHVRSTSLSRTGESEDFWVFGSRPQDAEANGFSNPDDPLAEHLIVPGDPWEISRACSRSARLFELLAAISFAAGLGMNGILLLFGLVSWIR